MNCWKIRKFVRAPASIMARIKSDEIQRRMAALDRKTLEPPMAATAKACLESIQKFAVKNAKLITF